MPNQLNVEVEKGINIELPGVKECENVPDLSMKA